MTLSFINRISRSLIRIVFVVFAFAYSFETLAAVSNNQRISFVDYDGNGYSDIISFGKQYGTDYAKNANLVFKITGTSRFGAITDTYSDPYLAIVPDYTTPTLKLVGTGRFDNDYATDLVWKEWWGRYYIDKRNLSGLYERTTIFSPEAANYTFIGIGDFNGDGLSDILWRSKTGLMRIYQFKPNSNTYDDIVISVTENNITYNPQVPNDYQCSGIGDFNGDGKSDLFWVVGDGKTIFWLLDGGQIKRYFYSNPIGSTRDWRVVAVGDICSSSTNGSGTIAVSDGVADIIWQGLGQTVVWQISKDSNINAFYLNTPPNQVIKGVGDYNNDGNGDILVTSDSRILYNNILPTQNQIQGVQTTLIIDIASNPYRDKVLASITPVFEGGFDLRLHTSRQFESRLHPMELTNFSMYLQPSGSYVLNNPTRWLSDLNLTGMGWGTTIPGGYICAGGGVAVGRRWILLSTHVKDQGAYKTNVYFIDSENTISTIAIQDYYQVGDKSTDLTLGYLAQDIPPNIKIYSVFPFSSLDSVNSYKTRIPVFTRNQYGKLMSYDNSQIFNSFGRSYDIERAYFADQLTVGDSGNPVFTIIENEPVLLGLTWTTSGPLEWGGTSSIVGDNVDIINSIMITKTPAEQLKIFSLDKFSRY